MSITVLLLCDVEIIDSLPSGEEFGGSVLPLPAMLLHVSKVEKVDSDAFDIVEWCLEEVQIWE